MTTLMRNGRDRRSGKPVKCHARKERALLVGTRSANHIRASSQSGCTQRPDTWLHPNASRRRQIPLASRAPSIHGASAIAATVTDPNAFRSGRDFAAWIGLVPRQDSTGGKQKLGPISKQGDRYLRRILVVGAHSVLRRAKQNPEKYPWL